MGDRLKNEKPAMTTDAALLAQLQSLWRHAAVEPPPRRPPMILKPPEPGPTIKQRRCSSHLSRADWLDAPAPNLAGWIRTSCRRCGAFIGYRPRDEQS